MTVLTKFYSLFNQLSRSPKLQLFIKAIFIIFAIFLFFESYGARLDDMPLDLSFYLTASELVWQGHSPYTFDSEYPFKYMYPPTFAWLIYPLTFLPETLLGIIWYTFNMACFIAAIFITLRCVQAHKDRRIWLILFITILLMYSFVQSNFKNGQINSLILFFSLLAWQCHKRFKLISALCLSLAISIKLIPAFLLGYFLMRKEWKLIGYTILFTTLLFLLPVLTLGGTLFNALGHYLSDFLLRHLITTPTDFPFRIPSNLFDLASYFTTGDLPLVIRICFWISTLSLVIGFDAYFSKTNQQPSLNYFTLYLYLPIFLSPISEKHHLILLIPSVLLVAIHSFWTPYGWKSLLLPIGLLMIASAKLVTPFPLYSISIIILLMSHLVMIKEMSTKST